MKRLTLAATLLVTAVAFTACVDSGPVTAPDDGTLTTAEFQAARASVPETTGNHLVVFRKKSVPSGFGDLVEDLGGEVVSAHDVVGAMLVTGLDDGSLKRLARERTVQMVEPEPVIYLPEIQNEPAVELADVPASPDDPAAAAAYARQWNMRAIGADQAWAAGHLGSPDVTVAILDTGIDYLYPDLQGRVDLARSVSLRPEDDVLVDLFFPTRDYITDLHYHGTHVAATVASNALILAGVTSRTTLIGVKVCSVYGGCTRVFEGIEHAVNAGANIINMSLGGDFPKKDFPGYVSVINRYITWMNSQGVLLVVSAGNDALDLDHAGNLYKTYCDAPHAVCVSATGPTASAGTNGPWVDVDAPAVYTNYGRSAIDVAAPGGNTGASVWAACSQTSLAIPVCQTGNYVLGIAGTSMASPHVAGLAAMVMAEYGTGIPSQTAALIRKTADDLGQRGTDPFYGKGRINAAAAMDVN